MTISATSGDSYPSYATGIVYQEEGGSTWSGSFSEADMMWQLEAGETNVKTIELTPTETGNLKMGLMDAMEQEVLEEWEVQINRPTAEFGETISFYDGLDLTLDAEVHESMDFELNYGGDQNDAETGTFSVSVQNGKWVKVTVVAENTNQEGEVGLPGGEQFSGLAGNTQLDSGKPRSLGEGIGEGTIYATLSDSSGIAPKYREEPLSCRHLCCLDLHRTVQIVLPVMGFNTPLSSVLCV